MSAITGIFYRDGRSVSPEIIKQMNDVISHRGPDGSSVWLEGPVALGHQMLHTTPESLSEELPFEDADSGIIITADARIDNRSELAPLLGLNNDKNVPDSLFILKSYCKWGEKCPEKLLGDFAFAIWDKNKKKIFCARDHVGVKPFYYFLSDNGFFFSTEIKALFTIPEIPYELNEIKMAFYLIPITEDCVNTSYKGIFRLPAAHRIKLKNRHAEISNYWKLDPNRTTIMDSHEDYVNTFREIFLEAVKCRLRTSFKLGSELSGGLDSSSIVGMVGEVFDKNSKIDTFSYKFNEITQTDESEYVLKMVELGYVNPHFSVSDNISPLQYLPNILNYIEEPPESPNLTLYWNLLKLAHKNNIRILLSGFDGDSALYRGEEYFKELTVTGQWKKLIHEIKGYSDRHQTNKLKSFFNNVLFPFIPKKIKYFWNYTKNIKIESDLSIINHEFKNQQNLKGIYKELHQDPLSNVDADSKKYHYYIINHGFHQSGFESMNKMSAAFNIELRFPLFDKRILEFCYSIPTDEKFRDGWDRILLRKTMQDILPKEVQWRPKKVTTLPVIERNLLFKEKRILDKTFHQNIEFLASYLDLEESKRIYEKYKLESKGMEVIEVYRLTCLLIWLQRTKLMNFNDFD